MMLSTILSFLRKKIIALVLHGYLPFVSDKQFLQLAYYEKMGKKLNLADPQTFNEKLQWLKLYDRQPEYTTMVDKYAAKKWVADRIGEEHIIPTLGVWDHFDEIDFDRLPDQFVLKCTHDSGSVVLVPDKNKLNKPEAKSKLEKRLKRNLYYSGREWPYKHVPPRIIAEKYMVDDSGTELKDYKLQCFGGKFDNVFVAESRFSADGIKYHYFDKDWNYLPYSLNEHLSPEQLQGLKPQNYEQMIHIAECLAAGIPALRVDLYEIAGKVYFGEATFFSASGYDTAITEEADRILGSKLKLPEERRSR